MNPLLHDALLSTKNINHAAILKRKDGSVKASSPHMHITSADFALIEKTFDSPREARSTNYFLKIMDIPYKPVRVDDMAIYGKKDQNGLIISRTRQYYIIGTYEPDMVPSIAAEAVEKLGISLVTEADYFRNKDK